MKTNKKTVRALIVAMLITLSILIQGCNFKKDVIAPWQDMKGINSECSVIC